MKRILHFIDRTLAGVENALIIVIVTILVLMSFLQVVLQIFFYSSIEGGDIIQRHLVLWVGFIGASLATREEKHIHIDLLTRIMPERWKPYIQIVIDLATMVICIVLAKAGYQDLLWDIQDKTKLFGDVSAWWFKMIIPLGFGLISFRLLLKALERILALLPGDNSGAPSPEPPS